MGQESSPASQILRKSESCTRGVLRMISAFGRDWAALKSVAVSQTFGGVA